MTKQQLAVDTLAEFPAQLARVYGARTALVYNDERLSFDELNRRSGQVASGLIAEGIATGTRVSIMDRNSAAFFEILLGTWRAGAVLVAVNFRLAAPEAQYILEDSQTEVLFIGEEFLPVLQDIRQRLTALRKVIVLGGASSADEENYSAWRDARPESFADVAVTPRHGAVQMYTSGTTGHPKGVELSHRAIIDASWAGLDVWPYLWSENAAVLGTMPLFHVAASNLCIAALFAGARAEILRHATTEELADILPERGITLAPLPATVIHQMLRLPDIEEKDFSALRTILVAGSGIAAELLREAGETFNCGFAMSYGSTETCGGVTYLHPDQCTPDAGKLLKSAGRVLSDCEVKIVDTKRNPLPAGEVGEVACKSGRLMTGYWRRPEATEEVLEDGWFFSGDAGYLDEDGYLFIVDRIKDMVLTGGENVYPTEIEQVMHAHPDIEDVAVVGIPDEQWGEALLAFVIAKPGAARDGDAIKEYLRDKLAGYKIPRRYEFIDAFPRNATGKVLKRELRAPYWEEQTAQAKA